MKKAFTTSIILSLGLAAGQAFGYGGYVKDSYGQYAKDSWGRCIVYGKPAAGMLCGEEADMAAKKAAEEKAAAAAAAKAAAERAAAERAAADRAAAERAAAEKAAAAAAAAMAAAKADENAEPQVIEVINLPGVTFAVGSARLTPKSNSILNKAADDLLANPKIKVIVAGHTDNTGDAEMNRKLSQKRAEAVRIYLIERGVPADRLSAKGFGESQPVVPNDTAAGRAKNRRVELQVIEN